jgi:uncharacterized iron-regulated protein
MPLTFLVAVALAQAAPALPPPPAPPPATVQATASGYVPERVYDTRQQAFIDFEVMLVDLVRADVVFVGEQHDDPNTHRLEHAVLEGLRRRGIPLILSFEMFERDVQDVVAKYLADAITEAELLKDARPWPRYASDYRALMELAKTERWVVVAANVPRRVASEVASSGKEALDRLSPADRALVARELQCPQDGYFERFAKAMGGHSGRGGEKPDAEKPAGDSPRAVDAKTDRYYWSQCVKDETMAESIATAFANRTGRPGPIVHVNGAFHSDFGQGTAERTRRRLPGRRVVVVTILPVADLDALAPAGEDLSRADYLVYTIK